MKIKFTAIFSVFLCWFIYKTRFRLSSFWLCGLMSSSHGLSRIPKDSKFQSKINIKAFEYRFERWPLPMTTATSSVTSRSILCILNEYSLILFKTRRSTKEFWKNEFDRSFKEIQRESKVNSRWKNRLEFNSRVPIYPLTGYIKKPNLNEVDCKSDSVITVKYEEKSTDNGDYSQSISEIFPTTTTTNRPGIICTLKNRLNSYISGRKIIKLNHRNRYIHFLCHYMWVFHFNTVRN